MSSDHSLLASLFAAIADGDSDRIADLVRRGAPVDGMDVEQDIPLFCAIDMGYTNCVRVLLEYGADPNMPAPDGSTPLSFAVDCWCDESIRLLVKYGADLHYRPGGIDSYLDLAIEARAYPAAAALLDLGLTAEDSLLAANHPDARTWLSLTAPSAYAAEHGRLDELRNLLAAGADPNSEGLAPLIVTAAQLGRADMVAALIEYGADLNAVGNGRGSALQCAARHGFTDVMRVLLDAGAHPNVQAPSGDTPLHEAVSPPPGYSFNAARTSA